MASVFQDRAFAIITKWQKDDGTILYAFECTCASEAKAEGWVMAWNAGKDIDKIRINGKKPEGKFLGADLIPSELDDLFHEHKDKDGNDMFPRVELTF